MKGSTYDVGQPIDDKVHYGEWNAVLIGDDWRLLNAYWGACAVGSSGGDEWLGDDSNDDKNDDANGEQANTGFMFTCDENYFLASPKQLIGTHLPFSPQWQLRDVPIDAIRFEEMAFLKDRFFNLGMSVISHRDCVITSNTGQVEIFFEIPRDAIYHKYYCLLFRQEGKSLKGFSPKYDRYLFIHRPKSDQLSIKIRSPVAGTFRLELVGMDTRIKSLGYDYDWIALYKIQFTKSKERCVPYPEIPAIGWGPGLRLRDMGLTPVTHKTGIVATSRNGDAQIEFKITDKEKVRNARFAGKISKGGVKEEKLRDRAVYRMDGHRLIFNVKLPRKGEYALKLYGIKDRKDGTEEYNFCNYMLVSDQRKPLEAYPRGFDKGVGVKESKAMGIVPLSHLTGLILTDVDELRLDFRLDRPVEYTCSLIGNDIMISDSKRLVSEVVVEDKVTFTIRLPKLGSYGFRLIAKATEKGKFETVVDYVIDYVNTDLSALAMTRTPSILLNLETPIDTPLIDETPEDRIKKRMDAAIVTEDEEELSKAIEDMKEVAKNSPRSGASPRGKSKKRDKKTPRGQKEKTHLEMNEKTSLDKKEKTQLEKKENTTLEKKEHTPLEQKEHTSLDKKEKTSLVKKEKTSLEKKEKTSLEKKEHTSLERKENTSLEQKEHTSLGKKEHTSLGKKEKTLLEKKEKTQHDNEEETSLDTKEKTLHQMKKTPVDTGSALEGEKVGLTVEDPSHPAVLVQGDELDAPLMPIRAGEAEANGEMTDREQTSKLEPKPMSNGITRPVPLPVIVVPTSESDEEAEVKQKMLDEVEAHEEKERAELAKEELLRAEHELKVIKVKRELAEAIASRDLKRLLAISKMVRSKDYQHDMDDDLRKAKSLIERLQHIQKLLHKVLDLDQNNIAEIKGYSNPAPAVCKVFSATLLILGHYVEETKEWTKIQTIFGKTGKESLKRRIEEFDINNLQPDIAMGAKEILKDLTLDQVRVVSAGAATFYIWTKGLINEMETRIGEDITRTRPRTSKSRRQRRASKVSQSKRNSLAPLTRVDL